MTSRREQLHEELSAFLDGELNEDEAREVERAVETDEQLGRELRDLRATRQLVRDLPREEAPADLVDRVMARAERQSLVGHGSGGDEERFRWLRYVAAAAVLLLAVGLGSVITIMVKATWNGADQMGNNGRKTAPAQPERPGGPRPELASGAKGEPGDAPTAGFGLDDRKTDAPEGGTESRAPNTAGGRRPGHYTASVPGGPGAPPPLVNGELADDPEILLVSNLNGATNYFINAADLETAQKDVEAVLRSNGADLVGTNELNGRQVIVAMVPADRLQRVPEQLNTVQFRQLELADTSGRDGRARSRRGRAGQIGQVQGQSPAEGATSPPGAAAKPKAAEAAEPVSLKKAEAEKAPYWDGTPQEREPEEVLRRQAATAEGVAGRKEARKDATDPSNEAPAKEAYDTPGTRERSKAAPGPATRPTARPAMSDEISEPAPEEEEKRDGGAITEDAIAEDTIVGGETGPEGRSRESSPCDRYKDGLWDPMCELGHALAKAPETRPAFGFAADAAGKEQLRAIYSQVEAVRNARLARADLLPVVITLNRMPVVPVSPAVQSVQQVMEQVAEDDTTSSSNESVLPPPAGESGEN